MRIAMAIFRAIPENGMRNCLLRIAEAARRRGHEIIVYTSEWKEESPDFIRVVRFNIHSSQYHKRTREFFFRLADAVREDKPAAVLGFNRVLTIISPEATVSFLPRSRTGAAYIACSTGSMPRARHWSWRCFRLLPEPGFFISAKNRRSSSSAHSTPRRNGLSGFPPPRIRIAAGRRIMSSCGRRNGVSFPPERISSFWCRLPRI